MYTQLFTRLLHFFMLVWIVVSITNFPRWNTFNANWILAWNRTQKTRRLCLFNAIAVVWWHNEDIFQNRTHTWHVYFSVFQTKINIVNKENYCSSSHPCDMNCGYFWYFSICHQGAKRIIFMICGKNLLNISFFLLLFAKNEYLKMMSFLTYFCVQQAANLCAWEFLFHCSLLQPIFQLSFCFNGKHIYLFIWAWFHA